MEYPKYNNNDKKINKQFVLIALIGILGMCFILPWVVYILGSLTCLLLSLYIINKSRGFKRVCGLFVSVMTMLLMFDLVDLSFSWSLDYVLPSFLIFLMITFMLTVLIRKKTWTTNYDTHMYLLMINVLMAILMFIGIITSVPLVIITLSLALGTMITIRFKVGKKYERNIGKFMHI